MENKKEKTNSKYIFIAYYLLRGCNEINCPHLLALSQLADAILRLRSAQVHHFVSKNQNLIQDLSFRKDLTVFVQTLFIDKKHESKVGYFLKYFFFKK